MKCCDFKEKIIIGAGLDQAGKTSVLKEILNSDQDGNVLYYKGIGGDNFFGRLAKRFGWTWLFLLELLLTTRFLRANLKSEKIILLDKYFFYVASHLPDVQTRVNRWLLKIFKPLMIKPDLIVYFLVAKSERIERLKKAPFNRHHQRLIDDPDLIDKREELYLQLIIQSGVRTIFFDTTNRQPAEAARQLSKQIEQALLEQGGD